MSAISEVEQFDSALVVLSLSSISLTNVKNSFIVSGMRSPASFIFVIIQRERSIWRCLS